MPSAVPTRSSQWTQQSLFGQEGGLLEVAADSYSHHERGAGTGPPCCTVSTTESITPRIPRDGSSMVNVLSYSPRKPTLRQRRDAEPVTRDHAHVHDRRSVVTSVDPLRAQARPHRNNATLPPRRRSAPHSKQLRDSRPPLDILA